jgi:diguanylate cyclase (GGDEF)-like protein
MLKQVAIYGGRSDLSERVREACPDWEILPDGQRDLARLAIVEANAGRPTGRSIVRLILVEEDAPQSVRRGGELVLARQAFLADPASFLAFAAETAEAAMHAARLEQEASNLRQIHELMMLVDAEAVSERIAHAVLQILELPHASLFLHDPRLERYVVSYSNDPGYRETGEFLPGIPPDALQSALSSSDMFSVWHAGDGRGMVVVPLRVDEDLLGVIRIPLATADEVGRESIANVTRYLRAIAPVLSNIYQLTRSRDLAMRDDLTKAYNRRFFESYLDEEIERSRRYGAIFSIIFLDLDDLKMVNNLYGHLAGSRTLQEVAKRILGAVRGIDKVIRFGGDEFCVVLPQTDEEQAIAVANRIARAIASAPLQLDASTQVSITASFGIASYPTHAITKEGLIRQADAAMYRVKSSTKNAVGVAEVIAGQPDGQ